MESTQSHNPAEQQRIKLIPFLLIIAAGLILRIICFVGIGRNDDVGYAGAARVMAEGNWSNYPFPSILGLRFGMVAPIALSYRLFGINEYSSSIYPLLMSGITIALTMVLAQMLAGSRTALFSGIILAAFPLDVAYSTQLVPSVPMATMLAAAMICLIKAIDRQSADWAFAAGICVGCSWLINEQTIVCAPIFLCYALFRQLYENTPKRKAIRYYLTAACVSLSIVAIEGAILRYATGGPWNHRFIVSQSLLSQIATNTSLWYYPVTFFKLWSIDFDLGQGYFGLFWYLFIAASVLVVRSRSRRLYFLIVSVASILLYLQFGVMSSNMRPIAKWIRYIIMLLPFAVIVVAAAFEQAISGQERLTKGRNWPLILFLAYAASNLYFSVRSASAARFQGEQFYRLYSYLEGYSEPVPIYVESGTQDFLQAYSGRRFDFRRLSSAVTRAIQGALIIEGGTVAMPIINENDARLQQVVEIPYHEGRIDLGRWRVIYAPDTVQPALAQEDWTQGGACRLGKRILPAADGCSSVLPDRLGDFFCWNNRSTAHDMRAVDLLAGSVRRTDDLLAVEMKLSQLPKQTELHDNFLTYYWAIDADGNPNTGRQDDGSGAEFTIRLVRNGYDWSAHLESFVDGSPRYIEGNSHYAISGDLAAVYLSLSELPVEVSPAATWRAAAMMKSMGSSNKLNCMDQIDPLPDGN